MQSQSYKRLALLALLPPLTFGALAAGAEPSDTVVSGKTFWELLSFGKEINIILGVMAFMGIFWFLHLLLITRKQLTVPAALLQEVLDDIASGDIERACQRASASRSLLGRVILPALKLHDHPVERLHQVCEGAGRRAVGALRQQSNYLANIGTLAPMLGLLGTVFGMVLAFESLGADVAMSVKQKTLTGAIAKALITTAAGLMVGIPSMAFYYFVIGRVNRISDELEMAAESIIANLRETR